MKKLIVNADDFGFTRGVNAGIARAFREGVVTSATIMATGDAFQDAVQVARQNPGLGVGCHLTLVGGRPASAQGEIPTLIEKSGLLPKTLSQLTLKLARGAIKSSDMETELRTQIDRIVSSGIAPTHVDTHKHTHIHPAVMGALSRAVRDFGISRVRNPFETFSTSGFFRALRSRRKDYLKQYVTSTAVLPASLFFRRFASSYGLRTPDRFCGMAITGFLDRSALLKVFPAIENGTVEIMCHPGIYDEDLEHAPTRLKRQRQLELDALVDPEVKEALRRSGITLINYLELN
jgi:hopanoid biosynthesis associated protein HpnK